VILEEKRKKHKKGKGGKKGTQPIFGNDLTRKKKGRKKKRPWPGRGKKEGFIRPGKIPGISQKKKRRRPPSVRQCQKSVSNGRGNTNILRHAHKKKKRGKKEKSLFLEMGYPRGKKKRGRVKFSQRRKEGGGPSCWFEGKPAKGEVLAAARRKRGRGGFLLKRGGGGSRVMPEVPFPEGGGLEKRRRELGNAKRLQCPNEALRGGTT